MNRPLSDSEVHELNKRGQELSNQEYAEFKTALTEGKCYLCERPLESFDEEGLCLHWLLRHDGFRKKHFKKIFDKYRYDQIESFLRWHANTHQLFRGINDLKEEHDGDKIKALTVKLENLEWSFDFPTNCVAGKHGDHGPHYHFQMRVDELPLHKYADRHIKLSEYECWLLEVEQGKVSGVLKGERYGLGMQGTIDDVEPETLLGNMRLTEDYDNATFHTGTLVMADEGRTISGDDIADMLEESNRTGVPMHQLVKRLQNVSTKVYIEPGPGVAEAAQRTPVRPGTKKKHSR